MAKCLMNRGVTGLRPPPGGAQAAHIVTSYSTRAKESMTHPQYSVYTYMCTCTCTFIYMYAYFYLFPE